MCATGLSPVRSHEPLCAAALARRQWHACTCPPIIPPMIENDAGAGRPLRIGAVTYLNTVPLVRGLPELLPAADVSFDHPSRLADQLADGRLDVALAPSVELARHAKWSIVSTACIGCRGPVLSVKTLF